jgi:hypothetical protein
VVFGIPAHKLFPGMFAEVEKTVTERARQLSSRLQAKPGQHHSGLRHKLAILSAIVAERKQCPANEVTCTPSVPQS